MTTFIQKADLILEALFTGADEAEIKRRDEIAPKIFIQEWVEEFLKRNDIKKNSDGSYDVDGNVDIRWMKVEKLPLKFNKVGGYFWCSSNKLTTLEGAPKTVGGYFACSWNQLTSLEGAPTTVGGEFWCSGNSKKFTKKDVRAVSNVKGRIKV